jgi:hypothetical protein
VSDTLKDLLVVERSGPERIEWYENLSGGGFGSAQGVGSAFQPNDAVAADFNGDDTMDVLATEADADAINWYAGSSSGFSSAKSVGTFDDPRAVAAADIDGDGDQDAFGVGKSDQTFRFYKNLGDTAFASAENYAGDGDLSDIQNAGRELHIADVENDGDLDALIAVGNIIGYFPNLNTLDREEAAREAQRRSFSLVPNPTNGRVQLRGDLRPGQPLQLQVRDLRGRKLMQRSLKQPKPGAALHLDLPEGIYTVTLIQGQARHHQQLMLR